MSDSPAILVTGGAGYIGSHACRALEAAGYQPVVYDDLSTGHRSFVKGPLIVADLLNTAVLAQTLAQYDVQAVMHFATASLVGESMTDPQKCYTNLLMQGHQGAFSTLARATVFPYGRF